MPGSIHYLNQFPKRAWAIIDSRMIVDEQMFEQLAEYSCSTPTGPSVGRIYKRNLVWPNTPLLQVDWRVFICEEDPRPGWVAHHPYHLTVASHEEIRDARIKVLCGSEPIP
jgi:hypothetical protein